MTRYAGIIFCYAASLFAAQANQKHFLHKFQVSAPESNTRPFLRTVIRGKAEMTDTFCFNFIFNREAV